MLFVDAKLSVCHTYIHTYIHTYTHTYRMGVFPTSPTSYIHTYIHTHTYIQDGRVPDIPDGASDGKTSDLLLSDEVLGKCMHTKHSQSV